MEISFEKSEISLEMIIVYFNFNNKINKERKFCYHLYNKWNNKIHDNIIIQLIKIIQNNL
jgi:hypothetical protein